MRLLLDTHVLLWWLNDSGRLSAGQQGVLGQAGEESPLLVSHISLWEVAILHNLDRIRLAMPLREWLSKAVAPPLVRTRGLWTP